MYALLADGTTVEIRPAVPGDFDAVKAMHEAMSRDNSYMRFFNISRLSAEIEARRICGNPAPGSAALLALRDGEVVGVASYVLLKDDPHTAEVAFAVADHMHHRGIATLLLEHLVSLARSRQVTTFTAETLTDNQAMLGVFADAGLPVRRRYREGVIELIFPLPGQAGQDGQDQDSYLNAVAERERHADVASLRHIFAPESVAVIGASRRRGTVGRAILDNIRAAGYAGRLYTGEPARPPGRRRAVPGLGARPARACRPGGDRGARRRGARGGRAVRPARRAVRGGDHLRARRRPQRRTPLGLPQPRHAPGRPGLLRGGGAEPRPGRHVRRPARQARRDRPGHAVGRPRLRPGRPPVQARHRDLVVRLGRRQARRVRQRHAAVVGTRRPDPAGRAVHRVLRQPASSSPGPPAGSAAPCRCSPC